MVSFDIRVRGGGLLEEKKIKDRKKKKMGNGRNKDTYTYTVYCICTCFWLYNFMYILCTTCQINYLQFLIFK